MRRDSILKRIRISSQKLNKAIRDKTGHSPPPSSLTHAHPDGWWAFITIPDNECWITNILSHKLQKNKPIPYTTRTRITNISRPMKRATNFVLYFSLVFIFSFLSVLLGCWGFRCNCPLVWFIYILLIMRFPSILFYLSIILFLWYSCLLDFCLFFVIFLLSSLHEVPFVLLSLT